ncbi:DUF2256 domain-containing protein [Brevundimonas aurifodinae]|uniref:DUF2256 domain-containing protein n=2 Tax=Brevundimonas TaxID=41275 RepID=A0ABV1NN84_9CAUL|nr:MAG: DUF2256 domain-containing protein [Brevundimonas sp. 12-68-7]OYX30544.1 MAG: DUF2256 domain-containing protein [Brevundimonas subvibrioides]
MSRKHVNKGLAPKKGDLPQKVCVVCDRPFAWRARWARDWDAITTCSDRCKGLRRRQASTAEPSA